MIPVDGPCEVEVRQDAWICRTCARGQDGYGDPESAARAARAHAESIGISPGREQVRQAVLDRTFCQVHPDDMTQPEINEYLLAIRQHLAGVKHAEESLRRMVDTAKHSGATWEQIGSALGISRQAAHERFSGAERSYEIETVHCADCGEWIQVQATTLDESMEDGGVIETLMVSSKGVGITGTPHGSYHGMTCGPHRKGWKR